MGLQWQNDFDMPNPMKRSTDGKSPDPDRDRYRVPILDRALDVMELLAANPEGLTLTGMTDRLAMPKNAVFRIATTLTLRGYAEREEKSKIYRLGARLLNLGHHAIGGERLVQAAGPVLTTLRDSTGETALLGALSGGHGVVLDQVPSSLPVKVVVEIGHAFPLHTAAPAKAVIAFLPDAERDALISGMVFKRHTRHTLTSARAYRRELEGVRTLGYAVDRGEESETFACAAAPVIDRRGWPVAAIWISGPIDRVTPDRIGALAMRVVDAAGTLSRLLGHATGKP